MMLPADSINNSNPDESLIIVGIDASTGSLEDELRRIRESLQTTIKELEMSNEELQSTNEELRTVNQEVSLKSSELEAANLQLKATNEQLTHEVEERTWAETRLEIERAKLDTIFQNQPNWINICDLDGIILETNPAGLVIMEASTPKQLAGKSLKDFVSPEYQPEIEQCITSIGKEGETHKREVRIRTLKGNHRWLEIHSVLIHLADDELRIMSIIVDHTERKQTQELLAERQQELAHIMRLNTLGEMASGIAHELNQPLSAIANYIRGCELRINNSACSIEEITEILKLVGTQVRRAGDIVRHAKDSTRKDQNSERHAYDINDIIRSTLYLLETTGQFNAVKLVTELDVTPTKVHINKIQIEQVLINMIQNALDSMAEASPRQTGILRVRTQMEGKHALRVLIVDEGMGLSEDFIKNIFRPFYTSKKNGMGMGLAISRSIIEAHGGKLEATNNCTQGATFSFTLPLEGAGYS